MSLALSDIEVIAPHFKRRLSGVTSTVIQLVPIQNSLGQKVTTFGPGLPDTLPSMRWHQLPLLWQPPEGRRHRVWHARRNIEMLPGILLRDVLRMPLKLVFTSASQRKHTGWTKWLISRMDRVIAVCQRTASYLERDSEVILHGIDLKRFSPAPDKHRAREALGLDPQQRYVGCFGRVRHQKGTDLFVDAMIRLLPSRPGWSAIIAGRATAKHVGFEEELKARVKASGLADRIRFVGEHTNINDWYRALDLFVAPQRWEGFGLTPLEAMASAVPVIAADVGAFVELIVDGETGAIVERGSLDSFSDGIASYLDDVEKLESHSAAALKHVTENFSVEREARAIGAVYAEMLANR
ncbi:glycosyltransferase family 4 protein [Rhizobium oryzicola]|uniref:Glycosyltransferase family 4 protein n=1 Tax=Rhizobium oryzicola TaxID=1232668 RepID=A0ABT8SW49_9HYPH|nr:glycosyltransferase family 4 protein [Rhizobium oryzicola]MDO1582364.1 glycosyltransferase family 4 protein [Rhizobium oryzicola]